MREFGWRPDQAAVCSGPSVTSTPSRRVTPWITLGNWFSGAVRNRAIREAAGRLPRSTPIQPKSGLHRPGSPHARVIRKGQILNHTPARTPAWCTDQVRSRSAPIPVHDQAMRTWFGRPNSSMRLRTCTATSISVARRSSRRERRSSPITCFQRPITASTLARRL
jgi:hypothetical protein